MISRESLEARLAELRQEHEHEAQLYGQIEDQLKAIGRNIDMRHGAIMELEALLKRSEETAETAA